MCGGRKRIKSRYRYRRQGGRELLRPGRSAADPGRAAERHQRQAHRFRDRIHQGLHRLRGQPAGHAGSSADPIRKRQRAAESDEAAGFPGHAMGQQHKVHHHGRDGGHFGGQPRRLGSGQNSGRDPGGHEHLYGRIHEPERGPGIPGGHHQRRGTEL